MSSLRDAFPRETSPSSATRRAVDRASPSRKRKREQHATLHTLEPPLEEPFQIYCQETELHQAPQRYYPICIVRRAQFPLAYLDTSLSLPSRLFRAHIDSLEKELPPTCASPDDPQLLVARSGEDDALYAVERVSKDMYALCKIGSWVDPAQIGRLAATGSYSQIRKERRLTAKTNEGSWWTAAAISPKVDVCTSLASFGKAPRLAMCRPDGMTTSPLQSKLEPSVSHTAAEGATVMVGAPDDTPITSISPLSVDDIFEGLIKQYLDTLYLSKTSLAYFAKGPISRARAAFIQAQSHNPHELATFLRSLLLSSSAADKKYRDKLPELLRAMPVHVASDQEHASGVIQKQRKNKNKKKKLKLDKHGMLSDEAEYFGKWWRNDDSALSADLSETVEQRLKNRSSPLRTRETFMQVIIVLEIMALEALPGVPENAIGLETHADTQTHPISKTRPKKAQDMGIALELLLDKLSIWHSLNHGEAVQEPDKSGNASKNTVSELRNFCVEVVVPFYTSRIPQASSTVNKKLGGPSPPSPEKSKTKARRPGELDARDRRDKKPRDPLQRVASETINQSSKPSRSLHRSATDSIVLPGLKREASETLLDQIPRKASLPAVTKRASILDKMRFRQREVDLTAMSQAQEAKKKKQADVEEKLREAISTLKKPNRALAGKETAEVAEQRSLLAHGRAKTSQSHRKHGVSSNIQIAATPKHGRTTDFAIEATPHHAQQSMTGRFMPSSAVSMVPSSSMKPPPHPFMSSNPSYAPRSDTTAYYAAVEATPSRGPTKFADIAMPDSAIRPFALAQATRDAVLQTPTKSSRTWMVEATPITSNSVQVAAVAATPVRPLAVMTGGKEDVPRAERKLQGESNDESEHEETNIYDALGWND